VKATRLEPVRFVFRDEQSGPDKLRGLVDFGAYRDLKSLPTFGFVFPNEYRDQANHLFLALKNGIGSFKGVETTFRFPLTREQVFQVSDFTVAGKDHHDAAAVYRDVILNWKAKSGLVPDMFFVLHPQTPATEIDTPYYACKARLLTDGVLSQNVTAELIKDEAKFRWSAANIALGAFVKLGGVPWVVRGKELDQELVVGVGRSFLFDPQSRATIGFVGFTACFSARGEFQFLTLANVADNYAEYLGLLGEVVSTALSRSEGLQRNISSLTLHVPKEISAEEMHVVRKAMDQHVKKRILQLVIVKVSEEETFFAVDTRFKDGVPQRGTVVQVSERDYLLYTEGREEKESWAAFRVPVSLRVTPLRNGTSSSGIRTVLRQVNDLSQVNWRGFNARSKPISIYYGSLIARLFSHIPTPDLKKMSATARTVAENRMWFI
jgi:argonaute-like protein implicated in RNA metabolism and viral defense